MREDLKFGLKVVIIPLILFSIFVAIPVKLLTHKIPDKYIGSWMLFGFSIFFSWAIYQYSRSEFLRQSRVKYVISRISIVFLILILICCIAAFIAILFEIVPFRMS